MLQLEVGVHRELHHCSVHSELSMGFDYLFDNYNHYQFNSMKIQIKNDELMKDKNGLMGGE